ncbi:GNAT family N-acetyltransferase (plasmid) [Aminobacter sp. BA135]|uniref:GNAT family N-acetyltransferase n=1 Tax=Aminobacter sp. BA135 TaxID=537596 RepID=UPI003D7AE165
MAGARATGWSEGQKQSFLAQQFAAQHHHYIKHYPGAERLVIHHAGRPIGRLYLARWQDEHRIVDVAFVAEACGQGYGTAVLGDARSTRLLRRQARLDPRRKEQPGEAALSQAGFHRRRRQGRLRPDGGVSAWPAAVMTLQLNTAS